MYQILPNVLTKSFLKKSFELLRKRNDFFLSFDYHSVGAYRLGDQMIKIKICPQNIDKKFGRKTQYKRSC